ncbi:MAG: ribosome maturation factor RimM [Lachnospiraceae bacterium]|nr:ribosome maturation factor RimM [Lachnospiraceae bacterium]
MWNESLLTIGKIISTHGLRGEVKVYPTLDNPDRFSCFAHAVLEDKHGERSDRKIERVRFFKSVVIVKLEGVDSVEEAQKIREGVLLLPREEVTELKSNQFFEADLIGLKVVTDEGEALGTLTGILHTGANDVYSVLMEDGREVLLPAIKSCILKVEVEEGRMTVHMMEGLLP